MPLYEYQCRDCQAEMELLVQGSREPVCPECGSGELVKQLSVVAAPSRDASHAAPTPRPPGGCGAGCGCHPPG